jgi:hypothetical protein
MTTRNGKPIAILYLHVNIGHAASATARSDLKTMHENKKSFKLSTNLNAAGDEAIIKLVGKTKANIAAKAWAGAIIRVYDASEINKVRAIVNDEAWTTP